MLDDTKPYYYYYMHWTKWDEQTKDAFDKYKGICHRAFITNMTPKVLLDNIIFPGSMYLEEFDSKPELQEYWEAIKIIKHDYTRTFNLPLESITNIEVMA